MRRFTPAWLVVLLTSLPVLAAEEAAHEPETFLGLPKWIWMTANLALFLWLLARFLAPPILSALDDRAKEIRDSLAKAQGLSAAAHAQCDGAGHATADHGGVEA